MTRAAILGLFLVACAPPACSDEAEQRLAADVRALVRDDGPVGEAAGRRLHAAGARAIAWLEPGLYDAGPAARRRIIKAMAGTPEARPILEHLARLDPDEDVRAAATRALR